MTNVNLSTRLAHFEQHPHTVNPIDIIGLCKEMMGDVKRLEALLNPRCWTHEMDRAWHAALPDLHAAFEGLLGSVGAMIPSNGWPI